MTRMERLKRRVISMSVEEFADLLGYDNDFCVNQCPYRREDSCFGKCKQGVMDWLNQEVEMCEQND